MKAEAQSPEEYIEQLSPERRPVFRQIRRLILENLPDGFEEVMSYGMIGYVVPHSVYPAGYHVNPKLPLPFLSIASQKNFIALYHMGIYSDPELLDWFTKEYSRYSDTKLDMGKSCIRFKRMNQIPFVLLGELVKKMTCQQWISLYEKSIKKD